MTTFRDRLTRLLKRRTAEEIRLEEFPTAEDTRFVHDAAEVLLGAIWGAKNTSKYIVDTDLMESHKKLIEKELKYWFFDVLLVYGLILDEEWGFVESLTESLRSGTMVLSDFDDVIALDFARSSGTYPAPQIMEHFAKTGELVELTEFFRGRNGMFLRGFDSEGNYASRIPRMRTRRLYVYDFTKMSELTAAGIDPSEHTSVPLEVRMDFSGFWDDPKDEEWEDSSMIKRDSPYRYPEGFFVDEFIRNSNMFG